MSETSATNPWQILRVQAHDGALEFHPEAALDVVELATELVGGVLAIRENATGVEHFEALSNLSSGAALAAKFAQKGAELGQILDGHITVLETMIDTFVAAGREYARADDLNADELGRITVPREASTTLGRSPESTPIVGELDSEGHYSDPGYWLEPHVAHDIEPMSRRLREHDEFEPTTIADDTENANALTYEDLYQLGRSIRAQQVADAGGRWKWMSQRIRAIFVEYANHVETVTVEQWRGEGREAAVAAVRAYAHAARQLSNSMAVMADNLAYTAGWLEATRVSMPQDPVNPAGSSSTQYVPMGPYGTYSMPVTVEDPTPEYQEALRQTYGVGIDASAVRVPVLPPVETAFAQVPVIEEGVAGGGSDRGPGGNGAAESLADTRTEALTQPVSTAGAQMPTMPVSAVGAETSMRPVTYPQPDDGQVRTTPAAAGSFPPSAGQRKDNAPDFARPQSSDLGQNLAGTLARAVQQASPDRRPLSAPLSSASPNSIPHQSSPARTAADGSGGRGVGGAASAGAASDAHRDPARMAKLFPRATSVPIEPGGAAAAPRSSTAPVAPAMGGPAGMGGAANGADKRDGHRRAAYLDSPHHFEEALGEAPRVVNTPVIER
ncbi:PPE domain-containing protein [Nocardia bhagyanarayanae]|uniref:PPE family protein n=1 Tax=Nocardia bhagyanarayanae TaxID=1215925 RepID=A0A543FI77_9NOCA|nr:PPE domain-containing protein [Nocardia bhagyanarayanae]TQM33472.1 PPE family protein [Nocardia bhagyanarayanae]